MDKKIIKDRLSERFISEDKTPGISVTAQNRKDSGKLNKAGVKAIEKEVGSYDKKIRKGDTDDKTMGQNKFNYTDDAEKTYHDEIEIMNGQEMIQYDGDPSKEFTDRAIESIEGSTRMGNKGGKGMGNAEATWGASSDDFGKNLVKKIKASSKKRTAAAVDTAGADKVPQLTGKKEKQPHLAVNENNENNDKIKTKESMKRLKFKKEINGVSNAIKLIPEHYKVDAKEFEMTDGNENYTIRWEGDLTEGRAVILKASDKNLVNEEVDRMKALMGYSSQATLGTVKGNARIDENVAFANIMKKSRAVLTEGEDIESVKPKTGSAESLDDAVSVAAEATKHIEGSASTDDGTDVPEPKKGSAESLDDAVSVAPEATKHIEGSASTDDGTQAPAVPTGEWDKINKPQSADASKHVTMGEGIELGGQLFEPIITEDEDADDAVAKKKAEKEDPEGKKKAPKDKSGAVAAAKSAKKGSANFVAKSKKDDKGETVADEDGGHSIMKGGEAFKVSADEKSAADTEEKREALFTSKSKG